MKAFASVKTGDALDRAVVTVVPSIRKLCVMLGRRRFTVRLVPADSCLRKMYPLTRWTRLFWYVVRPQVQA